jgi:MGT family glycosyltransferase
VLVSLGTLNGPAGQRFFDTALDAVAGLGGELQVIVVAPGRARAGRRVLVADHVPQLALLPYLSAVVSHGGHNTVCETLAYGLPLVVAPIRDDQPLIAQQVADAGAGVRVRFGRITAAELSDALRAVLDDPGYAAAARRIAGSFAAAGGAVTAADRLEKLT